MKVPKKMGNFRSLIYRFKVAAIPGCAFGLMEGCYLRVSYGMLDEEHANLAIDRLVKGIGLLCS
jgi:aspartate/methionine/tyrosine aminotransferase